MPASTAASQLKSLASPIVEWFVDDKLYHKESDVQYCLAWNTTGSMTDRLCVFRIKGGNATSVLDILYSELESYRFNQSFDTRLKNPMAIFRYRSGFKTRYIGVKLLLDLGHAGDRSKYQCLLSHVKKHCEGTECNAPRMQDIWQFGRNSANGAPAKSTRARDEEDEPSHPQLPKRRRFTPTASRNRESEDHSERPRSPTPEPDLVQPEAPPSITSDPHMRQTTSAARDIIDLTTGEQSDDCSAITKVEDSGTPRISQPKQPSTDKPNEHDVPPSDLGATLTVSDWLEKADLVKYRQPLEGVGLVEWKDLCRFAKLGRETQKAFIVEYVKDMTPLHLLFFTEALKELQHQH